MKEYSEEEKKQAIEHSETPRASEFFFKLHDLLKERTSSDGELLLINDSGNYYAIDQTGWREIRVLDNKAMHHIDSLESTSIIDEPLEIDEIISPFGGYEKGKIASLVIMPIKDEELDACLLSWKNMINEKYQVMVPLMVGSEMIGMTAQVKEKSLENIFPENVKELFEEAKPEIREQVLAIQNAISEEKKRLYEQLENLDSDMTIKEISKILVSQLMSISLSIESIKRLLRTIKQDLKIKETSYENSLLIESLLDAIEDNVLKAIFSTDHNNLSKSILGGKSNTFSQSFFENLLYPYMIQSCEEGKDIVCYLNPKIAKELQMDLKATYTFISAFIHYLYDRSLLGGKSYFNINRSKQGPGLFLEVITQNSRPEMDYLPQELIYAKNAPTSLRLLYEAFLRSGGTLQFQHDTDRDLKIYSIYIPAETVSNEPISRMEIPQETKIGFLIDIEKDYIYANNISRYLFSLGLSRKQFIASEEESIIADTTLTHLVIFESKFDKKLFNETLKGTDLTVMIVKEGCFRNEALSFYDFSGIDLEMYKIDKYLRKIEEFLIIGGLK